MPWHANLRNVLEKFQNSKILDRKKYSCSILCDQSAEAMTYIPDKKEKHLDPDQGDCDEKLMLMIYSR